MLAGAFLGDLSAANKDYQRVILTMRLRINWAMVFALIGLSVLSSMQSARAQTPSPLQEWQYSGGVILARLFQPDLPEFRVLTGLAAEIQPAYSGASAYKVQGGPVINVYYRDIAFLTTGEGIGYNFMRGDHYQVGAGVTYDRGRLERLDYNNLRGMGNINAAPVAKVFGTWVLSKKFPLILRSDVRQYAGGAQGAVADAGIYMPLPGSSKTLVMFAGPSVTVGTSHYLQTMYGVTSEQSLASGHPAYRIGNNGIASVGVGFSATKFITDHWLLNMDAAGSQLRGYAANSPVVERRTDRVIAVSLVYQW